MAQWRCCELLLCRRARCLGLSVQDCGTRLGSNVSAILWRVSWQLGISRRERSRNRAFDHGVGKGGPAWVSIVHGHNALEIIHRDELLRFSLDASSVPMFSSSLDSLASILRVFISARNAALSCFCLAPVFLLLCVPFALPFAYLHLASDFSFIM